MENTSHNVLELEIAELQKKIEQKRDLLEQQGGIVEEKELVSDVLKETFANTLVPAPTQITPAKVDDRNGSYLDHLDDSSSEVINTLIQKVPTEGIAKVVDQAGLAGPFIIDALHDALVDMLYEELKSRGIVK